MTLDTKTFTTWLLWAIGSLRGNERGIEGGGRNREREKIAKEREMEKERIAR